MDKFRKVGKSVRNFCPGSGSKKQIGSGRGSSNTRYTSVPPVPISESFENEIRVGAHDMNYFEVQENYGIEEENEVDSVDVDENDDDVDVTPESGNVNVQSESVNLPPRPPCKIS